MAMAAMRLNASVRHAEDVDDRYRLLEIGNYDLDIGSGQAETLGEGDATVTDAMGGIGQFDDL